jgi:EAL domain-containing protein (putative c-di-GMP-specific phosphodiesterase class I)/GGDEF domain-containing protein
VKPFRVRDLRIQVTAALAAARRSTNAARASARAHVLTALTHLIEKNVELACVVVELEHLPLLRASYGIDAVDRLCECVEQRLDDFDPALETVGALGPATFVAVASRPATATMTHAGLTLHRALAAPAVIDGQRIPIAARIGFAVRSSGESADSILNLAQSAADAARDCGQPYIVYDGDLRDDARTQQELFADAARAIHEGQLHIAYQPQHDLISGRCIGVEALARWHHPTRGNIPASVFIPLAERMDLIDELGEHMLRAACNDLAHLRNEQPASTLRVSVNASTVELRDSDYPNRVADALDRAGIPGAALRVEVTESLALDESAEIEQVLERIQRLGVQLSIDDFGTGYSSFSSLTRVPWAEIKLDRCLTTQCDNPTGRAMLQAIVAFGAALDIEVIAEGIETTAQLDTLRALGCRYGQGFLLGRPQPALAIGRSLERAAA